MAEQSILFADNLHFHERNFKSLFDYLRIRKVRHSFVTNRRDWLTLFGNYTSKYEVLQPLVDLAKRVSPDELFEMQHRGVKVFDCLRAEALSYAIPKLGWYKEALPSDSRAIFDKLYSSAREVLLLNVAATIDWINFWMSHFENNRYSHCCVFSGSLIYARTLLEVLKSTQTKAIVMESFFTGNDFYMEEKYGPIANNSDLRLDTFYRSIPINEESYQKDRIKAINKLFMAKNKNVSQPPKGQTPCPLNTDARTVVILGQVVNDFSILETRLENISTISFYRELISKLLSETDYNVIFKAHPWERNKANLYTSLTFDEISDFRETLGEKDRLFVTEDFNILELYDRADIAVVLNSQAGLEAAFHGLKCVQLGKAFYGNKGFTWDYESIDGFVEDLADDRIHGTLTLEEFDAFELFLVKAFMYHLVSVFPSGRPQIEKILAIHSSISLINPQKSGAGEVEKSVQEAKPAIKPKVQPVTKEEIAVPENSSSEEDLDPEPLKPNKGRKMRKFRSNPHAFFRDAKSPAVRVLRYLFQP